MARIRCVPCEVSFKYPNGSKKKGKVIKATDVKIHEGKKDEDGDYATRIELIQFDNEEKRHIRFAYWRRPAGKKGDNDWNWASQTTWVFPVDVTKEAIEEAKRNGLFV